MLFWKQKENGNRWCWRQMERGKENLVPVSPSLLINHSVEMYLSKVTSLYLSKVSSMYSSKVTTALWLLKLICRQFRQQITFFHGARLVCLSHLHPANRWSSIFAKLEISAKSCHTSSKSQFRRVTLRPKWTPTGSTMEFFCGGKSVENGACHRTIANCTIWMRFYQI